MAEVEVAEIARRAIGTGPRRSEARVTAPLVALLRRTHIFDARGVEVGADLGSLRNAAHLLVSARPGYGVFRVGEAWASVNARSLRVSANWVVRKTLYLHHLGGSVGAELVESLLILVGAWTRDCQFEGHLVVLQVELALLEGVLARVDGRVHGLVRVAAWPGHNLVGVHGACVVDGL